MNVWLMHIGEELPVDGCIRKHRYGHLADALAARGHDVLRWAPTFSHVHKRQRFDADHRERFSPRYEAQFVRSPGYRRNAGFERLRTYRVLRRRFEDLAPREPRPDVIVAAIPSLEWAAAAVQYGHAHDVPVVVDVRDLWPDVFLTAAPRPARPLGRLALAPYYRLARQACRGATALTGVSQTYLDWALALARRPATPDDRPAPLAFEPLPVERGVLDERRTELRQRGLRDSDTVCLFGGLFERSYDLGTVVAAARRFHESERGNVKFLLCGDGGKAAQIRRQAADLPNVLLPGWVDAPTLRAAASIAAIGLCAYSAGAMQSLPNKPFEYMAGRLAIASSLPGELADLLATKDCGFTYRAGDAESLYGGLRQIVDAPQRLEQLRSNALATWQSEYRSAVIYGELAERLERLASASARRRAA